MNLKKLFDMQKKLDEKILERFPHLRNEDLLPKKILALQVELGELCNCWRGFKYWSNDQEPRAEIPIDCPYCYGKGYMNHDEVFEGGEPWPCKRCDGSGVYGYKNPLLEEYADGLHFILSIGLETGKYKEVEFQALYADEQDIVMQFNVLFDKVGDFYAYRTKGNYQIVLSLFLALGEMLGFTWDQIEEAYMKKNQENHRRQEVGY